MQNKTILIDIGGITRSTLEFLESSHGKGSPFHQIWELFGLELITAAVADSLHHDLNQYLGGGNVGDKLHGVRRDIISRMFALKSTITFTDQDVNELVYGVRYYDPINLFILREVTPYCPENMFEVFHVTCMNTTVVAEPLGDYRVLEWERLNTDRDGKYIHRS